MTKAIQLPDCDFTEVQKVQQPPPLTSVLPNSPIVPPPSSQICACRTSVVDVEALTDALKHTTAANESCDASMAGTVTTTLSQGNIAQCPNIPSSDRLFTPVKQLIHDQVFIDDGALHHDYAKYSSSLANATPCSISTPPEPAFRSNSAGSSKSAAGAISISSVSGDICRICHCEGTPDSPLIAPCYCSGTLKYVHQNCLQQWIKSSQTRACEVCRFSFIMQTKLRPFRKWEKLDISTVERRKILCSVTFHVIAITCVMWSLYVLIDRTAEEIRDSALEWPFWTKLVVVAIGFTGGVVFMYVQCKMYVQLFRRWKAYNKVIFVQNGPAILQRPCGHSSSNNGQAMGGEHQMKNGVDFK